MGTYWNIYLSGFLPAILELTIFASGEAAMVVAPGLKFFVHIVVPTLFVAYVSRKTIKDAFLDPILPMPGHSVKQAILLGLGIGTLAVVSIGGAFLFLKPLVNIAGIGENLANEIGITRDVYIFVALWLVLINPLLEEYFWRGFVFMQAYRFFTDPLYKRIVVYGTGMLFALHHAVIIQDWFNWWQFGLVIVFLGVAGVIFNMIYVRSGSIISSYIAHLMADAILAAIGFVIFGYIEEPPSPDIGSFEVFER
jgi:membrane protease YdiL (CAAX protease family)